MVVTSEAQLEQVRAWLSTAEHVVVDIETTDLNPRKDAIIGIGLHDGQHGFYLARQQYDKASDSLSLLLKRPAFEQILEQLKSKKLVTYNGAFDLLFIKQYFGVDLAEALHTDVLLLAHTCDENRFSYGLKDVSADLFGRDVKAEQADMLASIQANGGTEKQFYKADLQIMAKYCLQDCALTWRVMQHYLPILHRDGLVDFFYTDEVMPLYRLVTLPMTEHGVRIDVPMLQSALASIDADIEQLEAKIQASIKQYLDLFRQWYLGKEYPPERKGEFAQAFCELKQLPLPRTPTGKYSLIKKHLEALQPSHARQVLLQQAYMTPLEVAACQELLWQREGRRYMFNLSSKDHLKRLFFGALKEQPLSRTPKGNPQVDDEFLDQMASKYEWAEDLRTYNRLCKIKGTYIQRFLDGAEAGRYYPQWKQHGTVTGRYSGDLQQLPRILEVGEAPETVRKHSNNIRNFFIADEGKVLIDADYESLEPHVFAHISKDPAIISIFQQGHDFYSTVAIKTENIQKASADKSAPNYLGKIDKARRQAAKAYALGLAYGETAYKLARDLGISDEEAERLEAGYWAGFPVLRQQSDNGKYHIIDNGWIATEFGRRRRLPEAKWIAAKYGTGILNSLELWKQYHEQPAIYEQMKGYRRRLKKALNAAINYPTQGGAASIVNRAAIALAKAYKEQQIPATIIANIHDEILVSCEVHMAETAAKIMQNCLENTTTLSVNLKAEPVIGTRYGAIK